MTTTSDPDLSSRVPSAPIENVPVTVDSKGRVRVSKAQREVILTEFERSGVSATRFAQRTGLEYSTLAGWLQRYRRAKPRRRARSVRLLEAVVESAPGTVAGILVLELPGGVRLEVADEKQAALAAALLRALQKPFGSIRCGDRPPITLPFAPGYGAAGQHVSFVACLNSATTSGVSPSRG